MLLWTPGGGIGARELKGNGRISSSSSVRGGLG